MKEIKSKTKDTRIMPINKAIKLLSDYQKNNYNGYKTLKENGYSDSYALKLGKVPLNIAKDRVAQALEIKDTSDIVEKANSLYEVIGITREDIINEFVKIIKQDINLAVKLRALEPLIKQEGIKWDEKEDAKAPQVVIKVDEIHTSIPDNG